MIDWLADGVGAIAAAGELDGARLGLLWGLPFAGLLLSIAFLPVLAPHFWEHHFGKVAVFWALALLVPAALTFGLPPTIAALLHTVLLEYVPFILIAFALFVVAGGIRVTGNFVGTPGTNTAMLAAGTLSASFVGTTGASMVLIRPMIRANEGRRHKVHVFVFFIFLVSNIGGALTPLGDPPLFLGFLQRRGFPLDVRGDAAADAVHEPSAARAVLCDRPHGLEPRSRRRCAAQHARASQSASREGTICSICS